MQAPRLSRVLGGSFQKADFSSVRGRTFWQSSSKTEGGCALVESRTQWGRLSGSQRNESPSLPGRPGWVSPTVRDVGHWLTCVCLGWGAVGTSLQAGGQSHEVPGSAVTGGPRDLNHTSCLPEVSPRSTRLPFQH